MAKEQISSINRALDILECFSKSDTEWTLKKISDHLNMPVTTVFRQLSTLVERKYLTQDPVRKSYHVGPRLLQLSSAVLSHSDLRTIARPELERLSDIVKETINLSLLLDRDIFYLDKVETRRSIVCNTKVGSKAPAHATSAGKIIMAYQSEAFIDAFCRDLPNMQPLTPQTITSPAQLREALIRARLDGYAMDKEEIEPGLICVGAPILGMGQQVLAAVSIAGPAFRMQEELESMIWEVKKTAANISRLLGGKV